MSFTGLNRPNLPNTISLFRVFSVVPVVILLSFDSPVLHEVAGLIFLFASLTDIADGLIARSTGQVTNLGKLIDPLADKILLAGAVIPLVYLHKISSWIAVLIFAREFAITGFRAVAASRGRVIAADFMGKTKTLIYTISLTLLMFNINKWGTGLLYFGVGLAILSAFKYFKENMDLLE